MLAGMTALASGGADPAPINLVAEPVDGGVRVRVVGSSSADFDAIFSLEVEGGGNVSRHRGSARLRAGDEVTLSTVTIGVVAPAAWRARLRVEPSSGKQYEQVRASD
jgi:hypothetical protein